MRQLRQHDIDQVEALLDRLGKGLRTMEEMAKRLQKVIDGAQERIDDWGKGGDLVSGVPERAEPKMFEIWQPCYHSWPLAKVGEHTGADFMSAVHGWVHGDLHTHLLWGDPQDVDGQIWAGGVPLFPSKEEAAAWNEKGEKE